MSDTTEYSPRLAEILKQPPLQALAQIPLTCTSFTVRSEIGPYRRSRCTERSGISREKSHASVVSISPRSDGDLQERILVMFTTL